jgi:hypothetical protein
VRAFSEPVSEIKLSLFEWERFTAVNMSTATVMTIGISALLGAALSLRFSVLVLLPTLMVALVSTVMFGIARGDSSASVAVTVVLVATAVQFSYLIGNIAGAAVEERVLPGRNSDVALEIQEHMEVLGSDGCHV